MKKHLSMLCIVIIAIFSTVAVFANSNLAYEDEARVLYELGLYKGINETNYEPDLESDLTREQATVILARLFASQDEIEKMSNAGVNIILSKFLDASDVSDWAKKEVAYGVSKGYIKGIETEDGFYFNPQGALKGIDYASLILQQLGITDFNYQGALQKLVDKGIITNAQKLSFDKQQLIRDDVVGISYNVLTASLGETTVIENLVNLGKVEKDVAVKFGFIEEEEPEVIPELTEPSVPVVKPDPEKDSLIKPTDTPTEEPTTTPETAPILYRADGAVKLGQWTLSNGNREGINVNKIYLSAVYGGQTSILKPAYVTDYSIEDQEGNVYATFSNISNTKGIDLQKPFVIDAMLDTEVAQKDICVYAKIGEKAVYGGTIELFLGDGTNIFEATGEKTGVSIKKTGALVAQDNGKITIAMSKVTPEMASYDKKPDAGTDITVGAFKLRNDGPKGVLMETIILKEVSNTTGNNTYTLKNEKMETIANATSSGGTITFNIAGGQKISSEKSEKFTVEMDGATAAKTRVQLRLLKEGTSYDSLKNEGYAIDIDDDLILDEVFVRS